MALDKLLNLSVPQSLYQQNGGITVLTSDYCEFVRMKQINTCLEQGLMHRKCSDRLSIVIIVIVIFQLTEILSSPDVHLGIILSQVVKPGLVDHKDSSSYDGRPGSKERIEAMHVLEKLGALLDGSGTPGHLPRNPLLAEFQGQDVWSAPWSLSSLSLGPRTKSALRSCTLRSPSN